MNILYISHLSNNIAAGPNWSVPASVQAQSKIDNVLWVDINDAFLPHWQEVKAYHNIREYGKLSLANMPSTFDNPDVVVFEGFYEPRECLFARQLRKRNVPYIVVPRGSLTHQAMHNHSKWKKKLAHWVLFDSFVHHAVAVQYLTLAECQDSGNKWNLRHFIIPNGFSTPSVTKRHFSTNGIRAIFIGRLDMYHKGLDMLLDVIYQNKDALRDANFSLVLYGPKRYDYLKIDSFIRKFGLSEIVLLGGEIFGSEKQRVILDADVMIMPSRFEGLPMGLLETMAYGLPCLVSDGTNMAREVAKADAGWCCANTEESLQENLMQMITERHLMKQKGSNASKLAEKYNWDMLAKAFHNQLINYIVCK